MSRLTPYFGIGLALLVGGLIVVFSNRFAIIPTSTPPSIASSTSITVLPNVTLPTPVLSSPSREASSTTGLTATSSALKTAPSKQSAQTPEKVTQTIPTPSVTPVVQASVLPPVAVLASNGLNATAATLRGALVNIICYAPLGSGIHSISGSGIFIDPKGIILTNAHVAQYFLLANRDVSCSIRTGSPATDAYTAELIYISPTWVRANATVLTQTTPSGTGQYDFALLAVTKSDTSRALPNTFPSIRFATAPAAVDTPVVIASFGAQFLAPGQIQSMLFPTVVFGSVKKVFTFATDTADVLSLGGSAAAQEGSSGGGVADASGTLVGTITTSTIQGATDTRTLSAITASYIRFQYSQEAGSTLDSLLALPTSVSVANFAPKIPALESIITAQLP